ncbi:MULTISPECIES: DUF4097 family beta strand repeat-containing protein [Micromonospora]|uniref:DUF4097 domain-containing protein n=1 Tax=Micromonospora solifontis TaxID=2487138 RepID=A0ABX9WII1_9ACTN|nr:MULTISPECIES: DUF4097 family beta strand repeat-containing protein [Micromonospora]NES17040.1 DUF4097 domain-containing protein [Micromonospora sp. PPF5-17B]NES36393.1 DUF4097 domain-containing protein [Micromonospora solifontis]NES58743.1 DUF4097 domain-containing protein [Micromonospora sp. PPF5-6]RNL99628.1 hypothetical protein EFE23_09480 [Micromonospora solifontis]
MALHRTAVAAAAATTLILLAGCDTLSFRRLDYDDTEAVKITRITVPTGGAGDVTVDATGPAGQVRIKRVVRYQGGQPDTRYEVRGDELVLNTDCGPRCTVSYQVTAPEGVAVRGETSSGNVTLSQVGAVDFTLRSGDISVSGARADVRAETTSGNIEVVDAAGAVRLRASSGNIDGRRLAAGVDAEATSGNVTVELDRPASARLRASSGDVELIVPADRYRVRAHADAGDTDLGVPNDPTATLLLDISATSGNVTLSHR